MKKTLAQLILVSNLDDHHSQLTSTCKTSAEIWDKLTSIYEQSNSQRLDRILESFFTLDKKPGENIQTYISRLETLFGDINEELKKLSQNELL